MYVRVIPYVGHVYVPGISRSKKPNGYKSIQRGLIKTARAGLSINLLQGVQKWGPPGGGGGRCRYQYILLKYMGITFRTLITRRARVVYLKCRDLKLFNKPSTGGSLQAGASKMAAHFIKNSNIYTFILFLVEIRLTNIVIFSEKCVFFHFI